MAEISPWRLFMTELKEEMKTDDLESALGLVKDKISAQDYESISKTKSPKQYLDSLEKLDLIGEDNTNFLYLLLKSIPMVDFIPNLEKYQEKWEERRAASGVYSRDPSFVGRVTEIARLVKELGKTSRNVQLVCLTGIAGMGKTGLAKEACYRLQRRVFFINLRDKGNMQDVFMTVAAALDLRLDLQRGSLTDWIGVLKDWIIECDEDVTIFLDNVDDLLEPGSSRMPNMNRQNFLNLLSEVLKIKTEHVKILLTSRYKLKMEEYNGDVVEIPLTRLDPEDGVRLLKKSSGLVGEGMDDDECSNIVEGCGHSPLAIRVIARHLKDGRISPAEALSQLITKGRKAKQALRPSAVSEEENIFDCLRMTFDALPDKLKNILVSLSVFQGSFTCDAANEILGSSSRLNTELDLEFVQDRNLLEYDDLNDRYDLHTLVRVFLSKAHKGSEMLTKARTQAEKRFLQYYSVLAQNLSMESTTKFFEAFSRFEVERANFHYYIELSATKGKVVDFESKSDIDMWSKVYLFFHTFLSIDERERYFEGRAKAAELEGNTLNHAFMKCWQAEQLVERGLLNDALKIVGKLMKTLTEMEKTKNSDGLQLTLARCYYIKGRVLVYRKQHKDSLKLLEDTLGIEKQVLKKHTLTARTLNMLGHVYFNIEHEERAKVYHEEAYNMLKKLVRSENHPDFPNYLTNIGACYHRLGNKHPRESLESTENYERALDYYDKAYQLQVRLKMEGHQGTATVFKNKATTLVEMERFEDARPLAEKALKIRRRRHIPGMPDLARALYFVGSIYLDLGKEAADRQDRDAARDQYQLAKRYFDEALDEELDLGVGQQSVDFQRLQRDTRKVLKKLHKGAKVEQKYEQKFLRAEIGGRHRRDDSDDGSSSGSSEHKRSGEEDDSSSSEGSPPPSPSKRARLAETPSGEDPELQGSAHSSPQEEPTPGSSGEAQPEEQQRSMYFVEEVEVICIPNSTTIDYTTVSGPITTT
ncbi:PREDICTED: uncharacterized protein LOC109485032 [Branchiostoma belcheri]|uniref:Uncharacterized protein LOC109485032 n=1 Tax=Branchiostoma belcheri TaxID=7741 RepID=A0A6P5ACI8_BRABE|nr:PREDICTED: uncharacterized protein LOC109485032 [Branchiostoma belcheri]